MLRLMVLPAACAEGEKFIRPDSNRSDISSSRHHHSSHSTSLHSYAVDCLITTAVYLYLFLCITWVHCSGLLGPVSLFSLLWCNLGWCGCWFHRSVHRLPSCILLVGAFIPLWIPWLVGLSCIGRAVVASSHNSTTTTLNTPVPLMFLVSVCLDTYV
jgi:hypothetical protein